MMNLKKLCLLFVILLSVFALSSCGHQRDGKWYRINSGADQINEIEISDQTKDGFYLKAECFNGANMGFFEGSFVFDSENVATYSGESLYSGEKYVIHLIFNDDNIKIDVEHNESVPEWNVLDFGNMVTISGEYSREKPVYDYSDLVLEKVFLSDVNLSDSVKEYLGDEKYKSFIDNFGMSTYIDVQEENDYQVIIGNLRGIGNWCAFCSTMDGYFYGINNYEYFSNDPKYKDDPPDFLNSFKELIS